MTDNEGERERGTFRQFKDSFFYGARTDLNFKFLEHLTDEEAQGFLSDLLRMLGRAHDTNDWREVLDHVRHAQTRAYAGPGTWTYQDRPAALLRHPLAPSTLALITSTGHFVEGDDPDPCGVEEMTQKEAIRRIDDFLTAEPSLSAIPVDTPSSRLRVRHPGYDVEGVLRDRNVALPIDRLREMAEDGRIGGIHPTAWSFVGACAQLPLRDRTGPTWVQRWKEEGFDAAVLVPV